MTIGNTHIPLAHPIPVVATNGAYILAALGLAVGVGRQTLAVVLFIT